MNDNVLNDQKPDFNFAHDTNWRIFRIMAEFVDGFTFLSQFSKTVTFFGSAQFKEDNRYCAAARELAGMLAKKGYTVVTGGGPGIMSAANRGAFEAGGESVGINITIPTEQRVNAWVTKSEEFNYFYTRKVMLAFSARAYIYFPGGFGTLDELFEILNLQRTGKIESYIPVILFGQDYWAPLTRWLKQVVVERFSALGDDALSLFTLVDTVEDALAAVEQARPRSIHPANN